MGYSIMTPFSSKKEKEMMLHFLQKHYKNYNELMGKRRGRIYVSDPTDDVSYPPSKRRAAHYIGFDYNGFDAQRHYAFIICQWMAMMCGKRKTFKGKENLPFIIYDGYEDIALITKEEERHKKVDMEMVEENGYRPLDYGTLDVSPLIQDSPLQLFNVKLKEEIERLTEAWKTQGGK